MCVVCPKHRSTRIHRGYDDFNNLRHAEISSLWVPYRYIPFPVTKLNPERPSSNVNFQAVRASGGHRDNTLQQSIDAYTLVSIELLYSLAPIGKSPEEHRFRRPNLKLV